MSANVIMLVDSSVLLTKRISKVSTKFAKLMESLSSSIRPCIFVGFGSNPKPTKNSAALLGWSYDWSDIGPDPPPWSDWLDKVE